MGGLSCEELQVLGALLRKLGLAAAGEDGPLAEAAGAHHLRR
jgi:hypothetical protein